MVLLLGPERSDPIGGSGDLYLGTFKGFLVSQILIVVRGQQENDMRNASFSASKLPFNLLLHAKQTNDHLFFILLTLPVAE